MQYDLYLIHGDLKDYLINEELESTMPWWTEVDPASLAADFPPEPEWIVPQELGCELPFMVRPCSTFEYSRLARIDEPSAWTLFQRSHPHAMGLYAFSRPSFSRDGSLAIVRWTFYSHDEIVLGDVGYARLAKIQHEWKVVEWDKRSIFDFRTHCVKEL